LTRVALQKEGADRLAEYLDSSARFAANRTDHWKHFANLSSIRVDLSNSHVELHAGAGFDSEFEHNFRSRSIREIGSEAFRRIAGRSVLATYLAAFKKIWQGTTAIDLDAALKVLGRPASPHKILAAHYANRLLPHLAESRSLCYLEIGAGSGYLAALMYRLRALRLIVVDLPEIIPYSFVYLTQRYPRASYALPNEVARKGKVGSPDFLFLTPDQIDTVPDACVNLSVNTASFGEMLPEQIREYFRFLRRVMAPGGLFFTVNRVEKRMSRAGEKHGNGEREIPVRFNEYPWLPGDRNIDFAPSDFHALVQPDPLLSRLCELERRSTGNSGV